MKGGTGMSAKAHRELSKDNREGIAEANPSEEVSTGKSRKFRIEENEEIPEAIKRIVTGQIDKGIERLDAEHAEARGTGPQRISSDEVDDDEAIHDARVCAKKTRGVLRLVRSELGRKVYKRENACFRDAA